MIFCVNFNNFYFLQYVKNLSVPMMDDICHKVLDLITPNGDETSPSVAIGQMELSWSICDLIESDKQNKWFQLFAPKFLLFIYNSHWILYICFC